MRWISWRIKRICIAYKYGTRKVVNYCHDWLSDDRFVNWLFEHLFKIRPLTIQEQFKSCFSQISIWFERFGNWFTMIAGKCNQSWVVGKTELIRNNEMCEYGEELNGIPSLTHHKWNLILLSNIMLIRFYSINV